MNFVKIITLIIFLGISMSISAQENEPVILEVKKGNNHKTISDKKEKVKHFLQFGIMSRSQDHFKNKYGVYVVYENCVITSFMAEKAKKNNKIVAQYLTEKYGETWKKDLDFIPYGL